MPMTFAVSVSKGMAIHIVRTTTTQIEFAIRPGNLRWISFSPNVIRMNFEGEIYGVRVLRNGENAFDIQKRPT